MHRIIIALAVTVVLSLPAGLAQAESIETPAAAYRIAEDPDAAETELRKDGSRAAKLFLAILLHFERKETPARNKEIAALLDEITVPLPEDAGKSRSHWTKMEFDSIPYDGTSDALIHRIRQAGQVNIRFSLELPCNLLRKHPALYPTTVGADDERFIDWGAIGYACKREDFPGLQSVFQFWDAVDAITIEPRRQCGGSIIRNYYGWLKRAERNALFALNDLPYREGTAGLAGLRQWAAFGTWNARYYKSLEKLREKAVRDLTAYYKRHFAKEESTPERSARNNLAQRTFFFPNLEFPAPGPMTVAILSGAPAVEIRNLLKSGWDGDPVVSAPFIGTAEPPLMAAVTRPDVLKMLLAHGVKPDSRNVFGKTALMAAAQYNDVESVAALIAAGADVNARSLHPGAVPGNAIFAKEPSTSSGPRNCGSYSIRYGWRTPLMYVAGNGSLEVIKLLLKNGADPAGQDSAGHRALDYLNGAVTGLENKVLSKSEREAAIRLLHVDINRLRQTRWTVDDMGRTPLHVAAIKGNLDGLKDAIAKGIDVNVPDTRGWTALQYAILNIYESDSGFRIASTLLEAKANPNPHVIYTNTPAPLALALQKKASEFVKKLLTLGSVTKGKVTNAPDHWENYTYTFDSYVDYARHIIFEPIIPDLVAAGADIGAKNFDVNLKNDVGETALMRAVVYNNWKVVNALLDSGANIDEVDNEGRTALLRSVQESDFEAAHRLLARGANPNVTEKTGISVLHLAVLRDARATAKGLIAAGADLTKKDGDGLIAHELALKTNKSGFAGQLHPRNTKPGFDCSRASTIIERAICADPAASAADRAMTFVFSLLRKRAAKGQEAKTLLEEQRQWLQYRARLCSPESSMAASGIKSMAPCLLEETKAHERALRIKLRK